MAEGENIYLLAAFESFLAGFELHSELTRQRSIAYIHTSTYMHMHTRTHMIGQWRRGEWKIVEGKNQADQNRKPNQQQSKQAAAVHPCFLILAHFCLCSAVPLKIYTWVNWNFLHSHTRHDWPFGLILSLLESWLLWKRSWKRLNYYDYTQSYCYCYYYSQFPCLFHWFLSCVRMHTLRWNRTYTLDDQYVHVHSRVKCVASPLIIPVFQSLNVAWFKISIHPGESNCQFGY